MSSFTSQSASRRRFTSPTRSSSLSSSRYGQTASSQSIGAQYQYTPSFNKSHRHATVSSASDIESYASRYAQTASDSLARAREHAAHVNNILAANSLDETSAHQLKNHLLGLNEAVVEYGINAGTANALSGFGSRSRASYGEQY